ncbi:hypothetical protein QBC35DRAFT_379879, partial [Podospora australis]
MDNVVQHQWWQQQQGEQDQNGEWDIEALERQPQNWNEAQRMLFEARAARMAATREQIEAQGIRPNVNQIVEHMRSYQSFTPFNKPGSNKRQCLDSSGARKVFDEEEIEDVENPTYHDPFVFEVEFEAEWTQELAKAGLSDANPSLLAEFRKIAHERFMAIEKAHFAFKAMKKEKVVQPRIDLIASISSCPELVIEFCKFLRPADIINLYSVHRSFHFTLNQNMRPSIYAWVRRMAPNAGRLFSSPVYHHWFIPDPVGRPVTKVDKEMSALKPGQANNQRPTVLNTVEGEIRRIPGLYWLRAVVNREIRVRDIIATLARHGHRLPPQAQSTVLKIWLIMDAATTELRTSIMNDRAFFTDVDMYIAQMFFIKLVLLFNDPVFGPQSMTLMKLFMGQKGLAPLWAFLRRKKYTTHEEVMELKIRYDVGPSPQQIYLADPVWGVPIHAMGLRQYEGWEFGGPELLMRPEELVVLEATRRELPLNRAILKMLIYGHIDLKTGNNQVPSLDEMYMSDDDLPPAEQNWTPLKHELINGGCGNVPFEHKNWKPKHARKARWKTLTDIERSEILEEEAEEQDKVRRLDSAFRVYEVARQRVDIIYNATGMGQKAGKWRTKLPYKKTNGWKDE